SSSFVGIAMPTEVMSDAVAGSSVSSGALVLSSGALVVGSVVPPRSLLQAATPPTSSAAVAKPAATFFSVEDILVRSLFARSTPAAEGCFALRPARMLRVTRPRVVACIQGPKATSAQVPLSNCVLGVLAAIHARYRPDRICASNTERRRCVPGHTRASAQRAIWTLPDDGAWCPPGFPGLPGLPGRWPSTNTATVRPGTLAVLDDDVHDAALTTGSAPCAWTGESR